MPGDFFFTSFLSGKTKGKKIICPVMPPSLHFSRHDDEGARRRARRSAPWHAQYAIRSAGFRRWRFRVRQLFSARAPRVALPDGADVPRVRLDGARQARLPEQEQVVRPLREGGPSEVQVPLRRRCRGRQLHGFRRRQWRRLVLDMRWHRPSRVRVPGSCLLYTSPSPRD